MMTKITQLSSTITIMILALTACTPLTKTFVSAPTKEISTPTVDVLSCPNPISPPHFNVEKMVTFALPSFALSDGSANGVVLQVVPLMDSPTKTEGQLYDCDVIIGELIAARDLLLSDGQILPTGKYQVEVREGNIFFINNIGQEYKAPLQAEVLEISSREVNPPEAIITIKNICYSWLHVQVCTEPIPYTVLTRDELGTIQDKMQEAVAMLADQGLLYQEDINIDGTISDMVGVQAVKLQQASILAAPTVEFPTYEGDVPTDGELLGVVYVVLDIDVADYPSLPKGVYAVYAVKDKNNNWQGSFMPDKSTEILLPATFNEVLGQIERPMAIVLDLRMTLYLASLTKPT